MTLPAPIKRLWGRIACALGHHDMREIRRISGAVQHIGCTRCKREWGINHDVCVILPWSDVAHDYTDMGLYTRDPVTVARRLDPANWKKRDPA